MPSDLEDEDRPQHAGEDTVPSFTGFDPVLLAQPARCTQTGNLIPAGTQAWQEIWSDGRPGAIVSREALIEAGLLNGDHDYGTILFTRTSRLYDC